MNWQPTTEAVSVRISAMHANSLDVLHENQILYFFNNEKSLIQSQLLTRLVQFGFV